MTIANQKELRKIIDVIDMCYKSVKVILDDEEDTYNGRSERWQESENGEKASDIIDNLSDAIDSLVSANDFISEALNV